MREIRLYQQENLNKSQVKLNERNYKYLTKVLRFKDGKITLFNGDGYNYFASVMRDGKDLIAKILSSEFNHTESNLDITLIQGIAKGDKMDYIIQKATELGVKTIVPIITSRVVVKFDEDKKRKRLSHWQEVAINSAEQCNRSQVPIIKNIINFSELIKSNFDNAFVLHHRAEQNLASYNIKNTANILIGPEGGLSSDEIDLAIKHNFKPLLVGNRVLRTETASLATIANLQLLFGS